MTAHWINPQTLKWHKAACTWRLTNDVLASKIEHVHASWKSMH